jgi:uncharacterized protein YndB with AHSA1/START domain
MTEAAQSTIQPEALRLQRRFDATPSQLYRYFTEAAHLVEWFGPEGVSCKTEKFEAHKGGSYELTFFNPDGSEVGLVGRFLQLEKPRLIQMTWRWQRPDETEPDEETLVTIRLAGVGSGTRLELTHERFGTVSEGGRHETGWCGSFGCLDEALSQAKRALGVNQ